MYEFLAFSGFFHSTLEKALGICKEMPSKTIQLNVYKEH